MKKGTTDEKRIVPFRVNWSTATEQPDSSLQREFTLKRPRQGQLDKVLQGMTLAIVAELTNLRAINPWNPSAICLPGFPIWRRGDSI